MSVRHQLIMALENNNTYRTYLKRQMCQKKVYLLREILSGSSLYHIEIEINRVG